MNRDTKIEKNYKMIMASKERIIPQVLLTKSRFGDKFLVSNEEFKRISFIVCNQICTSRDLLTLDELELLRVTFKMTQGEVATAIQLSESAISKWKGSKKASGLDMAESYTLKNFFKSKLVEISKDVSKNRFLIDLIVAEIKDNFISKGGINPESFSDLQDIVLSKLVKTEFDISTSFANEVSSEQEMEFEIDASSYLDELVDSNDENYSKDYLDSINVAV